MPVISLVDYVPAPRGDGHPWTGSQLQEVTDPTTGTWATVETFNFSDPDADPEHPKARDFTTEHATLNPGYYRVLWFDAAGGTNPSEALRYPPVDDMPTADDVASFLRARTRDSFGNELGYFNSSTRPTETQVRRYIESAAVDVKARLPRTIPEFYLPLVRRVIAIRAGMEVEISYDPDRAGPSGSAFAALRSLFDEGMAQLVNAMQDIAQGPRQHFGSVSVGSGTLAEVPNAVPSMFPHWTVEI